MRAHRPTITALAALAAGVALAIYGIVTNTPEPPPAPANEQPDGDEQPYGEQE